MKDLSVSLVAYNSDREDLTKLLASFSGLTLSYEFFVIDNSPADDLRAFFADKDVTYEFLGKNLGYGFGHNEGIKKSLAQGFKYHLVVNPDVFFEPRILETAFHFMENNKEIGHLGPKVFYPNEEMQFTCRLQPKPFDLFSRRFLPRKWVGSRLDRYEMREHSYDKVMEVPFLPGSFMFFRNTAIEEVGLFDDRFFMYMEDVDMTARMRKKFKTVFHPDVKIYHKRNTEHRRNYRLLWIFIQSVFRFYNKHGWRPLY